MKHKEKEHNKTRKGESLLLLLAGGIFIISSVWLWTIWSGYRAGDEEYGQIRSQAVTVRPGSSESGREAQEGQMVNLEEEVFPLGDYQIKDVDFAALQEDNPDIVGWIEVPGLELSYPVVLGEDNSYYLKHTFLKEKNGAGSIFMDMRNDPKLGDKNTIIYGHNMRNGSMFGKLKQYREEVMYQENPVFYYYTPDCVYQCQIISCRTVTAQESQYPVGFAGENVFEEYVAKIQEESWHESLFETKEGDRLMMLSTCTGNRTERFVIQGRMVELLEF